MPHFQNESSCETRPSNENEFDLHENERAGETHFHIARRLLLTQRQKVTRKWSYESKTIRYFRDPIIRLIVFHKHCFQFLWGFIIVPKEIKTMLMHFAGRGGLKVHYGNGENSDLRACGRCCYDPPESHPAITILSPFWLIINSLNIFLPK